jgi:hypothetical protein
MKRRLFTEDDLYYEEGTVQGTEVFVYDDEPTGVLDPSGNMIWRERHRIGFKLIKPKH